MHARTQISDVRTFRVGPTTIRNRGSTTWTRHRTFILAAVADVAAITARYEALKTLLDERSRRLLAAAESQAVGKGGISFVAKAIRISRPVIRHGIADLKDPTALVAGRVRKEGGGRKRVIDKDASLKTDLQSLLESTTRGDAQAALR
jgi:hypothetical protein